MKKPLIFFGAFTLVIVIVFFIFPEFFNYTSLDYLKSVHNSLIDFYVQRPLSTILIFFTLNTILAFLPLPSVSSIASLISGSIFGFSLGVVISSVSTAIGNLVVFLVARYFLQDYILNRYGKKMKFLQKEYESEEVMALFSFRLFPLIPSFITNLIMAISAIRPWTFFWVSWLGRLPVVFIYAWSGVQLAKINSIEDILNPKILGILILLASFPWILKMLGNYFKRER